MHEESADYNLLKPLAVLLDERHVGRAATRFHLSQSAMSRALGRLRETFGDELLVQAPGGYELTPRARTIQRELAHIMPRLAALIRGDAFEPASATDVIRIHCTDYATTLLGPSLFGQAFRQAPNLSLVVEPLAGHSFDDVAHGRAELALAGVQPPAPLRSQALLTDKHVCVVSADHPVKAGQFSLDDLARYAHVNVVALDHDVMDAQRQLLDLGVRPKPGLRVPYFAAAIAALPGTRLIAMIPGLFARRYEHDPGLRIARAPDEVRPFEFRLAWHPRLTTDPAHTWVRELIYTAAESLIATEEADTRS